MVPFRTPKWRKQANNKKYKRQDSVIDIAVRQMEGEMKKAVEYIMEHYEKTGRYVEPTLQSMYGVSEDFYRSVIRQAYHAAQDEKEAQKKHEKVEDPKVKKLAKWPIGIPRSLTGLEKIFRDRRFWPKIMKRSQIVTDRVRKAYLRKLQIKFNKILPDLDSNIITPAEAKAKLMQAWDATKPRVELIFRTETTTYFGKVQTSFFKDDEEIIGFMFDSIADRSRTAWCKSRHGLIYKPNSTGINGLAYNTPSIHWNCRSHLIALANTAYNRKLLEDPNRDPDNRKVAPLPEGFRK